LEATTVKIILQELAARVSECSLFFLGTPTFFSKYHHLKEIEAKNRILNNWSNSLLSLCKKISIWFGWIDSNYHSYSVKLFSPELNRNVAFIRSLS